MDELKINKWKKEFYEGLPAIDVEFESYFKTKKLEDCFSLISDGNIHNLKLVITDNDMPREIKKSLEKLLFRTMPEDSI